MHTHPVVLLFCVKVMIDLLLGLGLQERRILVRLFAVHALIPELRCELDP